MAVPRLDRQDCCYFRKSDSTAGVTRDILPTKTTAWYNYTENSSGSQQSYLEFWFDSVRNIVRMTTVSDGGDRIKIRFNDRW